MKRGKKMMLLAGLLVLVMGAYFAVDYLAPKEADPEATTAPPEKAILLALNADAVTRLAITRDGETVILARQGDGWQWEGDANFPLNPEPVDTMVAALSNVGAAQAITEPPSLEEYGLAAPSLAVDITAGGQHHSIAFGTAGAFAGGDYYATLNGDTSKIYVLSAQLFRAFNYGLYELPVMDAIPFITDGKQVTIAGPAGTLSLEHIEQGAAVSFTSRYNWFLREGSAHKPLATAKVATLLSTLSGTSWARCVAYNAGASDLPGYGLDSANATRIAVNYGENKSYTLLLGRYEGTQCYARPEGSSMVYLIEAAKADPFLLADYEALRPDDVFPVDWDLVTAFDVTVDGDMVYSIDIRTESTADGVQKTYRSNGDLLDRMAVSAVTSQLSGLLYSEVVEGQTGRTPLISVTCYLDHPDFPTLTLTLYPYSSITALSELNGEARLTVSMTLVNGLLEKVNALFPD